MRFRGYRHTPAALTLGNRYGAHFIEERVGPRFTLNGCGKPDHPWNFIPGLPERGESLYCYAIQAPIFT
jgi:hypothetical protein